MIIDISKWQPSSAINYGKLAKDVEFAFLRTQYGSQTLDLEFSKHARELSKVGVPYGAYAYALFTSETDAKNEAKSFFNRTKGFDVKAYVVDVEEVTVRTGTTVKATIAFINELRKYTEKPIGLYTGHSFYTEHNMKAVANADFLWIPRYSGTSAMGKRPTMQCDLWQYSDKGTVNGYKGNVDVNISLTGKMNKILGIGAYKNAVVTTTVKKTTSPVASKSKATTHVVAKGETLGEIAKKYNVKLQDLVTWNKIKDMNLINVGNVIKLKKPTVVAKVVSKATPKSTTVKVTVKTGDTVGKLASKYGTTISKIKSWNKLDSKCTIYVGKKLIVRK